MAALLDDDSGSAKVSWNLDAIVASGVAGADLGVLYMHICNSVSGCLFSKNGSLAYVLGERSAIGYR